MIRFKHNDIVKLLPAKILELATIPGVWETPAIANRNWYRVVGRIEHERAILNGDLLAIASSNDRARREFSQGFPFYLDPITDVFMTKLAGARKRGSSIFPSVTLELPTIVTYGPENFWVTAIRTSNGTFQPTLQNEFLEVTIENEIGNPHLELWGRK